MLYENRRCDNCTQRGDNCDCAKGPSWTVQYFKDWYNSMQWWDKLDIYDPMALVVWQTRNFPKIIPSADQAFLLPRKREYEQNPI